MNTAKTLQLLDVQSNNISPATNIESIYYEVMDGGVIYRNSLYRHFPIYVKYNNNVDEPINVNRGSATQGVIQFFNDTEESETLIGNTETFRLSQTSGHRNDILLSSIRQSHLKNTRYYKLDISTYNFSDIMSLYAPKLWVKNKFNNLDTCIGNITYDSSVITHYYEQSAENRAFIRTTADVGSIEEGTLGTTLNKMRINDLLDKILFNEVYPYIYDASVYMDLVETAGNVPINIASLKDFDNEDGAGVAQYGIFVNPGKLKLVYYNSDTIGDDPNTKLLISILDENGNGSPNINVQKSIDVSLGACYAFYNEKIQAVYNSCPNQTPNRNYSDVVWKNFENNIINSFRTILEGCFSESYFDSINWITDVIAVLYESNPSQYPRNNSYKKGMDDNNAQVRNMFDRLFGKNLMFKDAYFKIINNNITISSTSLTTPDTAPPDDYKTNYGNVIETADYLTHVYCNYYLPYNDYNHTNGTVLLQHNPAQETIRISNTITLSHKFTLYVPIVINNKVYYITGIKEQYIEHIQNTAEDTIIYIPKNIDNSDLVNNQNLPELYAIAQGGIFMPANNWVIYKIYHDSENDYTDTPYSDLKNLFNIYVIKAQKSYDNNVIGSTRTIKIKIHTK